MSRRSSSSTARRARSGSSATPKRSSAVTPVPLGCSSSSGELRLRSPCRLRPKGRLPTRTSARRTSTRCSLVRFRCSSHRTATWGSRFGSLAAIRIVSSSASERLSLPSSRAIPIATRRLPLWSARAKTMRRRGRCSSPPGPERLSAQSRTVTRRFPALVEPGCSVLSLGTRQSRRRNLARLADADVRVDLRYEPGDDSVLSLAAADCRHSPSRGITRLRKSDV